MHGDNYEKLAYLFATNQSQKARIKYIHIPNAIFVEKPFTAAEQKGNKQI
jgi:hypothetical protein